MNSMQEIFRRMSEKEKEESKRLRDKYELL